MIVDEDNYADQDVFVSRYSEFKRFIEEMNNWIAEVMKDPQDVSQHDSVSKANSAVSRTSSTNFAKLRIKAEHEEIGRASCRERV